jgi:hypothetical protein
MAPGRAWEPVERYREARLGVAARRTLVRLLARRAADPAPWRDAERAGALTRFAGEHGLLGALLAELARRGESLPEPVAGGAAARAAEARLWGRHVLATTVRFAAAVRDEGGRVAALKGPFLAERLYGDVAARESIDVDLLVDERGLAIAESLAIELGFARQRASGEPDWHRTWLRAGFPRVELHVDLSGFDGTRLAGAGPLARAIEHCTSDGKCVPILAPEDELLYLAVHAYRHGFVRLAWEADLFLFLTSAPVLDWSAIGRRARASGVRIALAVALAKIAREWRWRPPRTARRLLSPRCRVRCAAVWLGPGVSESRLLRHYRGLYTATTRLLLEGAPAARAWIRFVAARIFDRITLRYYRRAAGGR